MATDRRNDEDDEDVDIAKAHEHEDAAEGTKSGSQATRDDAKMIKRRMKRYATKGELHR